MAYSLPPSRYRHALQQARTRQGRRKSQFFICEGIRCCWEALRQQPEAVEIAFFDTAMIDGVGSKDKGLQELIELCDSERLAWIDLESKTFKNYAVTKNPQGIILLGRRDLLALEVGGTHDPFILLLDGVADPGNLGTILRTAHGVGLRQVWYTKGSSDPFNPKTVRAGMGAQFSLGLREFSTSDELQENLAATGIKQTWITSPRAGISCYSDDFELRGSVLVLGNEAHGPELSAGGDYVHIPMPGNSESLNVAQAGTVFLFEGVRRGIL
ncbi:MAG: TrmH family RNA methyltransferase [Verrucomicrobiota bacterium]